MMARPGPASPEPHRARRAARLAAVQALYQIELTGGKPDLVITEFVAHRFGRSLDGERAAAVDRPHFAHLVDGAVQRRDDLDTLIRDVLAEGWSLKRLGALLHALMRAAAFELLALPEVPARVVIDEYVTLSRSFFADKEPSFVNGALDRLAHRLRPAEFDAPAPRASDDGPGAAA
jgi:N utilization substance protein B